VLAARARRILEEATALVSSVREVGAEPAGDLRIVLPVGLPPQLVTPLFSLLRQRYPRLSLRVRFAEDPLATLRGDVDVVAHFGRRTPSGSWVSYEMLRVRERLVACPDYLRRKGTPATPEELGDHDLLAWDAPDGDPTHWPIRNGTTLRVVPQITSTDIHALRCCAAAGLGIAFLPDADLSAAQAPADRLVPVLAAAIGRERTLRVVVPANLSEIPRIRAVLTEIRTFLRRPA
jgi:DNA-binding transcriptional LysR family regulator